jgi:hypothetical protein
MRAIRLAPLVVALATLALGAAPASAQFVPGMKTHFFKPENVKQTRVALPRAGVSTVYLMVYMDPPVNGDGALAWVIPCPCDELQRTLELSQLAQMFESGAIKGVAYAPDEPHATTSDGHSMYFDQPMNQKAYRIKGLFFSEAGKMQMLQPMGGAVILPSPPAAAGLELDTDRPGGNLRHLDLPAADPELCRVECSHDPACGAFTYVHPGVQGPRARCYLKSGAPPAVASTCCISGLRDAPR